MNAENLKSLQRLTEILESKVAQYIREQVGVSAAHAGISANTIARNFTADEYLKFMNAAFTAPSVKAFEIPMLEAASAGDIVLSAALANDREIAVNQEASNGLDALRKTITEHPITQINPVKSRMDLEISVYTKRLWRNRTANIIRISAASACLVIGGYSIFKSFD